MSTNGLEQYPDIMEQLQFQQWGFLTRTPRKYCQNLIWEFYASHYATLQATNSGLRSQIEAFNIISVWGVSIDISLEAINQYYLGEDYALIDTSIYDEKANTIMPPPPVTSDFPSAERALKRSSSSTSALCPVPTVPSRATSTFGKSGRTFLLT
ncbi:hypothetical protein HAX54_011231 [Datura stramonium]|uniref:Uncharacterized protein n=1 Tax=Datura stramonium TaxID=4076 RepID=A0ABS8Y0E0_DATST|nr:hypothetical protein [Datura stramonium]